MSDNDREIRFGTLTDTGEVIEERTLRVSDVRACPWLIMVPEHYREDGSCRCDDPDHVEMVEAGYEWDGSRWRAREE